MADGATDVTILPKPVGRGVVGMEGKMLDMPHLKQAHRALPVAKAMARRDTNVRGEHP